MTNDSGLCLLTLNTGSSSLRAAVYRVQGEITPEIRAEAERIGHPDGRLRVQVATGQLLLDRQEGLYTYVDALNTFLDCIEARDMRRFAGIGHRIVHGGATYREPTRVTDRLMTDLRTLVPIDPEHLPQAIGAIETVSRRYAHVLQVACFDTGFHRYMPAVARFYALPRSFQEEGVIRYGFHGLSYEYIMDELGKLDPKAAGGRVIIAHLGNGASMAAVRNGRGIDTTMGFTPTGGLIMGTRSGDLDPGALVHLIRAKRMSADELSTLVNKQAGMLGISGMSGDMRDLLQQEADDANAALAVDMFCYAARKALAALAGALGGLDTVVFTGGIGEHAAAVRQRIGAGLEFLGLVIDERRNTDLADIISPDGSPVTVRVMKTDEDLMIARHTARLTRNGEQHVSL